MPRFRFILLSLAFCPLLAGTSFGQTPAPLETEAPATMLKINARSVLVDVVVKDKDGSAVPGMRKEDFQVNENGKRLTFSSSIFHRLPTRALPLQLCRRTPSPTSLPQLRVKPSMCCSWTS